MRVGVVRFEGLWDEPPTYRLCEADGTVCVAWLPDEYPHGPLDAGGFDSRSDALAFRLGVDRERALHGLLPGVTAADIDRERAELDGWHAKPEPLPEVEAPVVERRVA